MSQISVFSQFFIPNFDPYNVALRNVIEQQQAITNEFINKQNRIDHFVKYKSYDGKTIKCIVEISRNSGLSNVRACVSNNQEDKKINLNISDGAFVFIQAGGNDWALNFGDVITVNCDQASVWKYKVGVDDNMTEPDWNRMIQNIILTARNSRPNETLSVTNAGVIPTYIAPDNINNNINANVPNVEKSSGSFEEVICSFCHGTGYNPGKEYPPDFGSGRALSSTPCKICNDPYSHYHKNCPSCNGKGYNKKFVH
jgi:hypothetical protein